MSNGEACDAGWTLVCDELSDWESAEAPGAAAAGAAVGANKDGACCADVSRPASVASSFEPISRTCSVDDSTCELLNRFFGGAARAGAGGADAAFERGGSPGGDSCGSAAPPAPLRVSLVLAAPGGAARVKLLLVPAQPGPPGGASPLLTGQAAGAKAPSDACADSAAPPPTPTGSVSCGRPFGAGHLRLLNWLVPGIVALLVGHLTAHTSGGGASCDAGGNAWLASHPRGSGAAGASFNSPAGSPLVLGVCSASHGRSDAVQLVFTSYAACAGGRGAGCPMVTSDWGGNGWSSDGYSA